MTTDEKAALAANASFYDAFARGDFVEMDRVWADLPAVLCVHPGWGLLAGRDEVMASWRAILRRPPLVEARDPIVELREGMAVVVCTEVLQEVELVATTLFVRDQGRWRMLHHHSGLVARKASDLDDDDDDDDDEPRPLMN